MREDVSPLPSLVLKLLRTGFHYHNNKGRDTLLDLKTYVHVWTDMMHVSVMCSSDHILISESDLKSGE